eukprot:Clim_evm4s242 gene=Clim_evmTU4s242
MWRSSLFATGLLATTAGMMLLVDPEQVRTMVNDFAIQNGFEPLQPQFFYDRTAGGLSIAIGLIYFKAYLENNRWWAETSLLGRGVVIGASVYGYFATGSPLFLTTPLIELPCYIWTALGLYFYP